MILFALILGREILLQRPVDKDVPPANLAEKDALGSVVEQADVVQGDVARSVQKEAQGEMLDSREPSPE